MLMEMRVYLLSGFYTLNPTRVLREDPLVRYEFEEIKTAIEFDQTGVLGNVIPVPFLTMLQLPRTLVGSRSSPPLATGSACGSSLPSRSSLSGLAMVLFLTTSIKCSTV